jgi:glycosyltransferase involved in cell wall biosynthesis
MLQGLVTRLEGRGRIAPATWVSLAREPARLKWGRRTLDFIAMPQDDMQQYATAKNALWAEMHGLSPPVDPREVAAGLARLGRAIGRRSAQLHEKEPFDLFYTHDFQLISCSESLPAGVPRVFRWHGPPGHLSRPMRELVAHSMDDYDAVIVSTRSYARELRSWGVRAPIHATYPYLDESARRVVTAADVEAFDARHGIEPDHVVFALVARMDAIKSQDVAIRALARLSRTAPEARLVLVGGGGFSGGRQGLGLSQASDWRATLEALAKELGVQDRVVFTGGVSDAELDVVFTRARAVLLPSALEGFGLAAVEGWLYGKPAVVSRGAGVAELVEDGANGFTFAPGDDATLAQAMLFLAKHEEEARLLGIEGRHTARVCHLDRGADDEWNILRGALHPDSGWSHPARRRW